MNHISPLPRAFISALVLTVALALTCRLPAQEPPSRICVAIPNAQMGQGASGADVAGPVRALLIDYLSGPVTEIVPLESRIDIQLQAEATKSECRFMVTSWVIHKKAGKGLKSLVAAGSMLSGAAPMMGAGDYGSAMMAQSVMQGAAMMDQQSAYEAMHGLAQSDIGKGDRITFEYSMTDPASGQKVVGKKYESKAKSDGEDILSPLLQQAAVEIVTAATR